MRRGFDPGFRTGTVTSRRVKAFTSYSAAYASAAAPAATPAATVPRATVVGRMTRDYRRAYARTMRESGHGRTEGPLARRPHRVPQSPRLASRQHAAHGAG